MTVEIGQRPPGTLQLFNQSALRLAADPSSPTQPAHPYSGRHLSFSKNLLTFLVFFSPQNKVNPFAGGSGLPSEVETWQNEDDRPASEVVEEMEAGRGRGIGGRA